MRSLPSARLIDSTDTGAIDGERLERQREQDGAAQREDGQFGRQLGGSVWSPCQHCRTDAIAPASARSRVAGICSTMAGCHSTRRTETAAPSPADRVRHRPAEVLDLACVALVLVANIVAAIGGFRWESGSLRLSMASSSRAILVALVLLLVRWWRFPGAPAHPWIGRVGAAVRGRLERCRPRLPSSRTADWLAGPESGSSSRRCSRRSRP